MAYATAQQALEDGSIIYGRGNVTAKRTSNGFIYWPKQAGAAMDAASTNVDDDGFSPEVKAKIARAKAKVALDAEADRKVKELFPALLLSVAMDDAEAEQEAQGSFSSEEDEEELERGEVTGNDADTSFEQSIIAANEESKRYWAAQRKKIAASGRNRYTNDTAYNHSKKTLLGSKGADVVSSNVKAARSFSLFDNAATIIKRLKRA